LQYIQSINNHDTNKHSLVDVGPYPGTMVHLIRDFISNNIQYNGFGLNFSEEYYQEMSKFGCKLFETNIDPDFFEAKECKEWPFPESDLKWTPSQGQLFL
jgi:hypothetical protein